MSLEVFVETGFPFLEKPVFLSDDEYSKGISTFVFGCADSVVIYENKILLVKRKNEPCATWWEIGGRMRFGELPEEAAARCFNRETGLKLAPNKFKKFGAYVVLWKSRAQSPKNSGTHSIIINHVVRLTEKQLVSIRLDDKEYTGQIRLLTPREVVWMANKGDINPYFIAVVSDLIKLGFLKKRVNYHSGRKIR